MADDAKWLLLQRKRIELATAAAFGHFRSAGIEPILIKGWAVGRLYPAHKPRFAADIDLAISSADLEKAENLIKTASFENIAVDLHRELRHLDTVAWQKLFSRSQTINLDGTSIRILADEDHLRVLAVHWLSDGGMNRDRLWDIHYTVTSQAKTFDWDRCFAEISPTRQKWIRTVVALAAKYTQLDVAAVPFDTSENNIPRWIIKTLEKEWRSEVPISSLHLSFNDPKRLLQQLAKRFPPNAIQSTIEAEGEFDENSRLPFQIKSLLRRAKPSLLRIKESRPLHVIGKSIRSRIAADTRDRIRRDGR